MESKRNDKVKKATFNAHLNASPTAEPCGGLLFCFLFLIHMAQFTDTSRYTHIQTHTTGQHLATLPSTAHRSIEYYFAYNLPIKSQRQWKAAEWIGKRAHRAHTVVLGWSVIQLSQQSANAMSMCERARTGSLLIYIWFIYANSWHLRLLALLACVFLSIYLFIIVPRFSSRFVFTFHVTRFSVRDAFPFIQQMSTARSPLIVAARLISIECAPVKAKSKKNPLGNARTHTHAYMRITHENAHYTHHYRHCVPAWWRSAMELHSLFSCNHNFTRSLVSGT